MNRVKMIVCVAFSVAVCVAAWVGYASKSSDMGGFGDDLTIFVANDIHYLSPRLTDYGEHFMDVISHADGKVTHYTPQITKAFIAQILRERPDAVILSGDLTLNGSYESNEEMAELFNELPKQGISVFVIPGNHDVDGTAYRLFGDATEPFDGATTEEFRDLYANLGFNEAASEDAATLSYTAKLTDGLWLLVLDVNGGEAHNFVPDSTMKWVESRLKQAKSEGARVIAVSHQNLLTHNERFMFGYQITADEDLIKLYKKYNVIVNLSAHIHIQHIARDGKLTDIATSSMAVSPNQFGVLRVTKDGVVSYETERVDVERWARETGANGDLLNFTAYSEAFFVNSSRDKREGRFAGAGVDAETEKAMERFAVELNRRYFAGTLNEITEEEMNSFRSILPDGFFSSYIDSFKGEINDDMRQWSNAAK